MKKVLYLLPILFLLSPLTTFGAYSYTRTPSSFYVRNPIAFSFSADSYSDLIEPAYAGPGINSWRLRYESVGAETFSACVASTTLSQDLSETLSFGPYQSVSLQASETLDCTNGADSNIFLEGDGGTDIFLIAESVGNFPFLDYVVITTTTQTDASTTVTQTFDPLKAQMGVYVTLIFVVALSGAVYYFFAK